MNRKDLLKYHGELTGKALDLMRRKNHDYAGGDGASPFANFQRVESMGVCSTERGFLVRIVDKISRLSTLCEAGKLLVKDETAEDSLLDLVNYAVLMGAFLKEKKEASKNFGRKHGR